MDLTVSLVNWNTRDELEECILSVLAQKGVDLEVIVVDNGSKDGSAEMVTSRFPNVTLFLNNENRGFSKAQNQAIAASKGRYIMLLNPDALIPDSNTLSEIVAFMDGNPDIGILGPRILNTDGSLHFSARRFPTIGAGLFRRTPLGKLFPNNRYVRDYVLSDWAHDEVRDVDWVSGAALVIRKQLTNDIGTLDERFFMYCEDVDWAYRAKQAGWRVCYYPMVKVIHRIGAASDQAPFRMIYHFHRSMFIFFLKHYAKGWRLLLLPAIFAGIVARGSFATIHAQLTLWRNSKAGRKPLVR
jgi:GT2 family glycosyltransferase